MRRALGLLVLVAACADDLPRPELIADLRVLAMRADPPSGAPGTEVTLDALVVAPEPETTTVARAWLACVPEGGGAVGPQGCALSTLPAATCADAPEAGACLLGGDETARYRLPAKALEGRPEGQSGQVYIVLLVADSATIGLADCARALDEGGAVPAGCRVAAKRVAVTAAATATANPTVSSLVIDGERVAVVVPGADAADPPFLSWFVTAGELDDFRTDAVGDGLGNRWTPPGQAGRIFVVVRDGKGGEGWVSGQR